MKLSGRACTETMSGAEIARWRERAEGNAGGVRLERRVRQSMDYRLKYSVTTSSAGDSKAGKPKQFMGRFWKAAHQPDGS